MSAAGAEITDAASRCAASIPRPTKAASTAPAMVAKPPTMRAVSSDRVMAAT